MNFNNVEELVFANPSLRAQLPEFNSLFGQWQLSKMTPGLRTLGQRSLLDFLQNLQPEHVAVIEKSVGQKILVEKSLDWRSVKLMDFSVEEAENRLGEINPLGEFSLYRKGDRLYICCWK